MLCYAMFVLTVCWAMNIYIMLTCYMYYRVPFFTREQHLDKNKQYRISSPRPDRE